MLAVYASPPPSPAVDARLATGLRAADFPDRTFTGKSTSAFHGAPRFVPLSVYPPVRDLRTMYASPAGRARSVSLRAASVLALMLPAPTLAPNRALCVCALGTCHRVNRHTLHPARIAWAHVGNVIKPCIGYSPCITSESGLLHLGQVAAWAGRAFGATRRVSWLHSWQCQR
jgi:hypothetical protein